MDLDNPFRTGKTGFELEGDFGPALSGSQPSDGKQQAGGFNDLIAGLETAPSTNTPKPKTVTDPSLSESLHSDAKSVLSAGRGVSDAMIDQGIYNTVNMYSGLHRGAKAFYSWPSFFGSYLPGQTGEYFSRKNQENTEDRKKTGERWEKIKSHLDSKGRNNAQASADVSKLQGKLLTVDDGYERMSRGFV